MVARSTPRSRLTRRAITVGGAVAGVAGAVWVERRHLASIAADPEYRSLVALPAGRRLEPIVSADGTSLHAEAYGSGDDAAPVLVLGHGWTERIAYWRPVIERLTARDPELRVVAYDLRGHGDSGEAAGEDYSLPRFGEDVEAVLAAVGGEPARTAVGGHSLGAMAIAAWADGFDVRSRVAAAALVSTGLSDLIGGALVLGELGARVTPASVSRAVLGSARPMLPTSTPLSLALSRHIAFAPDTSPGKVAFYERMLMETHPRARAAAGIAMSDMDLLEAVPKLTVPTLVVTGDRDRLTPSAHAHRIAQALPQPAGLLELADTGHMTPLERPDEVAAALSDLLAASGVTTSAEAVA